MKTTSSEAPAGKDDREDYRKVFRWQIFQLIKMGHDRLNLVNYQASEETDITGELVKEIKNVLEDRCSPKWVGRFSISEENPINAPGRAGKHRKRVDIEFERVRFGPRPRYPFEAKRLSAGKGATVAKYLGSEGLGEFLSGHYGINEKEAGMLAYVQTHNPEHWADKTERVLLKNPAHYQVCTDGEWRAVTICSGLDNCYCTKHDRSVGRAPLHICHCFLRLY